VSAAGVLPSTAANFCKGAQASRLGTLFHAVFGDSIVTVVHAYTDFHLGVQTSDHTTGACRYVHKTVGCKTTEKIMKI